MSSASIFRGGKVKTQSFSSTLGEIQIDGSSKQSPSAMKRQRINDQAREQGFATGQSDGFEVGRTGGYQAGYDQAYVEASNEQAELLRQFATDLQQVHTRLEESIAAWFAAAEIEVESLSVRIAETLVGAQLHLDRSFVIETTKAALQQLTEANRARIRVNPFDSVILTNAREELLAATASLRGVEIVDDATILGGCVVETDCGVVDATIETRLRLLEGGLEGAA